MSKEEAILRLNYWAADFKYGILSDESVREVMNALSEDLSSEAQDIIADMWGLDNGS